METIVTHGDVKILKYFDISNKAPYHYNTTGYHTGVDIECSEVYSGFPGTVILVNKPDCKTYTAIVQYNAENAFAYCNLQSVNVEEGQQVDTDDLIGTCSKFAHVEYLTKSNPNKFRVLLTKQVFYKHDPINILLNGYNEMIEYSAEVAVSQSFLRNLTPEEIDYGD